MAQTMINGGTQIASATITQAQLNVASPTTSGQVATKGYVDATSQGLSVKVACQAATTSANTFTVTSGNVTQISGTTVDGYSPAVNDYILIKDAPASTGGGSANSSQPGNGIYQVTNATTNLTVSRASFMNSGGDAPQGAFTFVESGTTNASSGWVVSSPAADAAVTYGTTAIQWTQFSGAGEITVDSTLTKTGNQLSRPALTGDVTASTGSNATTIASGAVTLAKMANLAANSVIANTTGSAATPTATSLTTGATASAVPIRDGNANLTANAFIEGVTTTATAAGTTTLTVSSTQFQQFTGSTTQTVVLPNATTMANGQWFHVTNRSTGAVTVNMNGGSLLQTIAAGSMAIFTLVSNGTAAGTWDNGYISSGGSGTVTSVSVATANGFSGTVANATTTPAITVQSNVGAGLLASSGVGGAIQAATATNIVSHLSAHELLSGTPNGSLTTFTTAQSTPNLGSEMVFQNGLLLRAGGSYDYTFSGNTVTFNTAPATGDVLLITYWY